MRPSWCSRAWAAPVSAQGGVARLTVNADVKVLDYKIPNVLYQVQCNNRLYDERCGLNKADWKVTVPGLHASGPDPGAIGQPGGIRHQLLQGRLDREREPVPAHRLERGRVPLLQATL